MSRGIVMSMRRQVLSFLFFSRVSGLLAAMFLSVWMDMSHRMVTLSFSVTALGLAHTIVPSPQYQTLCRSSSACAQLSCVGGVCIQF